jgi:NAD+ synthase
MNNCDYSFGAITLSNTKPANLKNSEFIEKYLLIRDSGKSYMTLFIDNIRLYNRPSGTVIHTHMENPGVEGWMNNRSMRNKMLVDNADQDLLKLCSHLYDMNFIIFTGYEDIPIDNEIFDLIPNNILSIYASNSRFFGGKVVPMPFGLMYGSESRLNILRGMSNDKSTPTQKVYINHNIKSNPDRVKINEFFSGKDWVSIDGYKFESDEDYRKYLSGIKNHKFVICPDGNAIDCDCYRNWETLYMRRVPIVKRTKYQEEIFKGLPVLFVDKFEDVTEDLLNENEKLCELALSFDMKKLDSEKMYKDILDKYKYLDIIKWIKNYAKKFKQNLVVGISGGIDSALVSTLCAMTGINTYVVSIPINQNKDQLSRAKNHIHWLKSKYNNIFDVEIDMSENFKTFESVFDKIKIGNISLNSKLSYANSKSRMRMMTLYQISANVSGIVVGTGNKVEDFGIGFFTKYGDGGVDISPIADLKKSEVKSMAKHLGINEEILSAKPTDGLWEDDRNDEDQIGATYEELEWAMDFTSSEEDAEKMTTEDLDLDPRKFEVLNIYKKFHENNKHKMVSIPVLKINNKI